ncbi:MAG: STAS domain-containing protein [Armatimonadota bacterium]|nr:STAS domain-containing protein [Armatimonadota bacterium]
MEMDLRILVKENGGVPVIELGGELDAYTCSRLRDTMIEVIENGNPTVIVSMLKVEYIDSSGLGTLVGGLKRASESNGRIAVVCTSPQIRKVFEITGLVRVFPLYESEQEATNDLKTKVA